MGSGYGVGLWGRRALMGLGYGIMESDGLWGQRALMGLGYGVRMRLWDQGRVYRVRADFIGSALCL